jgi:uncharacterized integral membrane protein
MQFLKTLFWVVLALVVAFFFYANWQPVTIELWGGLEADIKKPVLVAGAFLLGFLPSWLLYRARLWSLRRRLEAHERNAIGNQPASASEAPPVERPAPFERRATADTGSPAP